MFNKKKKGEEKDDGDGLEWQSVLRLSAELF